MPVVTWSSIELLHNVIRTLNYLAALSPTEGGRPLPVVRYKAKVKQHGTNCGVQVHTDSIVTQSRETILTPEADPKGFARWVRANEAYFRSLPCGIVVFGEWCGAGVEPGMAVSTVGEKQFAVFGIQVGTGEAARVVYDPSEIAGYLSGPFPKNMHVLPWMDGVEFVADFTDPASLQATADYLNGVVAAVEQEDPWAKAVFGVSGLGEGVVLYPVEVDGSRDAVPAHPEALAQLMFKAKGEKHSTTRQRAAVQVSAEVVTSIAAFVDLMVTEARLEQGLSAACLGARDPKLTRGFIQWMSDDVKKESEAELEASGLVWTQVEKAVQTRAREWFVKR